MNHGQAVTDSLSSFHHPFLSSSCLTLFLAFSLAPSPCLSPCLSPLPLPLVLPLYPLPSFRLSLTSSPLISSPLFFLSSSLCPSHFSSPLSPQLSSPPFLFYISPLFSSPSLLSPFFSLLPSVFLSYFVLSSPLCPVCCLVTQKGRADSRLWLRWAPVGGV